jgi:hypothetical protein
VHCTPIVLFFDTDFTEGHGFELKDRRPTSIQSRDSHGLCPCYCECSAAIHFLHHGETEATERMQPWIEALFELTTDHQLLATVFSTAEDLARLRFAQPQPKHS